MSENETPSQQHDAIRPKASLELISYQMVEMKDDLRSITRQLNRFIERTQEQESDFIKAVERCAAHGEQIKDLKEQIKDIDPQKSSQVSFWSAIAAMGAGVGAWLSHFFGKGP